ncbi:MAG TPA: hypothetical protein H9693_05470 [Firmicutes bacterium]|nr:hypothetical protein [Bacillota bacterium]
MFGLLSTYDLTDYGSFRALGIVLTLIAVIIVLVITIAVYSRSRKKEIAGAAAKTEPSAEPERQPVADTAAEETSAEPEVRDSEEVPPEGPEEETSAEEVPAEESAAEEPVAEEEAPAEEEIAAEETPAEEPAAEEQPVEEPAAEEIPVEEPMAEEVPAEEAPAEEPAAEETPVKEPAAEEPAQPEVAAAVVPAAPFWAQPEEEDLSGVSDEPPAFFDDMLSDMTQEEKDAFFSVVIDNPEGLALRIRRPLGVYKEEKEFLRDFFLSVGKLRASLPAGVIEKLYKRNREYMPNDYRMTRLNGKMIAVYFFKRAEEGMLDKCIELCKEDIALNIERRKIKDARLPSLKRLVLIYASQKEFEKAIELCDTAIERRLIDKKDTGYEARRDKLAAKLEKQLEKEERARMREERRQERERRRQERERKRLEREAAAQASADSE